MFGAVQPRRAREQLRRIDHVRRAALVHVDDGGRHPLEHRAGGAGVIEMDVRQQHRPHIARRSPRSRRPLSSAGRHDVGPGSISVTPDGPSIAAVAITRGMPRNFRSMKCIDAPTRSLIADS